MKGGDAYDAVVIGAGVGGLFCANFLAAAGRRTLLLERNAVPGGSLVGFKRKGFYFDAGDQSFEDAGLMLPMLAELGLADRFHFERARFRLVTRRADVDVVTPRQVTEALAAAYPDVSEGVRAYGEEMWKLVAALRRVARALPAVVRGGNVGVAALPLLGDWRSLRALVKSRRLSGRAMAERHFPPGNVRELFAGVGYAGWSALDAAMFWYMFLYDCIYPRGGTGRFTGELAAAFVERGGEVRYRAPVGRILVERGAVRGVETVSGETFRAPVVVSACDYGSTVLRMLREAPVSEACRRRVSRARISEGFVTVYLGLKLSPEALFERMRARHVLVFPRDARPRDDDPDYHAKTWVEMSSPSLSHGTAAPEGMSSLVLQAMSPYDWMSRWGTGENLARTPDYAALKELAAAELVATAGRVVPNLASHVVLQDVATPLTHERYTGNARGSSTGWTWDRRAAYVTEARSGSFGLLDAERDTGLRGLHAASHWALSPGGVVTAALAGKLVADKVVRASRR